MASAQHKKISAEIKLPFRLKRGADGYVVAECADLPGCITQGKTKEEALANLDDIVSTSLALIVRQWLQQAKGNDKRKRKGRSRPRLRMKIVCSVRLYSNSCDAVARKECRKVPPHQRISRADVSG